MKDNIAVLVGGHSTEYDASILSYEYVVETCENKDSKVSIKQVYFIKDQHLYSYIGEIPQKAVDLGKNSNKLPLEVLPRLLVESNMYILNLLHGNEGEDGCIQGLANIYNLHGSFESVIASSLSMQKWQMAEVVDSITNHKIKKIPYIKIKKDWTWDHIEDFVSENKNENYVVKPNSLGASLFTRKVEASKLKTELENNRIMFDYDNEYLLQPHINGREFTVGVIKKQDRIIVLPIVEIFTRGSFLGHDAKHTSGLASVKFNELETNLKASFERYSKLIFEDFGFRNFIRIDYMVENDLIYFLEVNSIPGITKGSIFTQILNYEGIKLHELIKYFIDNDKTKDKIIKKYRYNIER